ncbi:MAG: MauE/DoxX family redox-associated membrane protein [Candidatus Limnocylindria bacterium]
MVGVLARLVLGLVLAGSAALKLASPGSSRAALGTFDIEGERLRWVAWGLLVAVELGLAAEVIAGSDQAAWLAAAFLTMFAAVLVGAIMRGRAGAPCACFGSRSTVGWGSVVRNLALAACFVALPFLPDRGLSTDEWLGLGLVVALLLCLGLAVAVLALAREVGMLRLRLGPAAALEIPEEGPELGDRVAIGERFERLEETDLGLAVFTSDGCRVCQALGPAIRTLATHPAVSVEVFDEVADADVWRELAIPGSPFALALDASGTVLAKGTFNNLAQLESVLATAEQRRTRPEPSLN